MKLYHYWRSSSSWRVRWALAYKKVAYEGVAVDLLSGESDSETHLARHPFGYVPVMEIEGQMLTESLAMIRYLEDVHPKPSLLGEGLNPIARARIVELAETINADTQPLQNLDPQFLHSDDPEKRKAWAKHWIVRGLTAYERLCSKTAGKFSVGDSLSVADLCLVPQLYNARRYEVDLSPYTTIARIEKNCADLESYRASEPSKFEPKKV
ncbi:MAG: maleylacetoacetate isomerase [Bdellovibrionales bacterium]|nr:maleylacetoacetate isomerase [Bdellovibrionales bacterium]